MRFRSWMLYAALSVCVCVATSAIIWLGKNVFETYAVRDSEIRAARIAELTHAWETAIFKDWTECIEKLNAILPEDFSESSVRTITKKTRFRFPARVETGTYDGPATPPGEKFSLSRENGLYVLRRKTPSHGIQSVVFEQSDLFKSIGELATKTISLSEQAALRIVPVGEERGFGIVRELPGAKLEFDLATRENADSVAAKHAIWFAGVCVFAMLAAIVVLALRVFSLSEKRYLFASAVSHELKTPIAELQVCTETALNICREKNTYSELEAINRSSRELSVIVENLLFFSRMKNRNLHFSAPEFSVETLFSRIFDRLGEHLLSGNADAVFDIAPDARERRLRTSVEMLGRILFNLTDNAVKYAFREYDDNTLIFRVRAVRKQLCIEVEDNGPGIPQKYHADIFKPFERATAQRHTRGLGLGLPVSAEAAKILGGKLFLLKSDASGTTFRLELPLL
ncbi:MAG: HAMP domain-containing histidine kinase [Opitutales bacterium]|nr:HAMP domain-containing histidine kinase [Opitutales bacterium]